MNFTFEEAEEKFESGDLAGLADFELGYKYLLIRSLGRKDNLIRLAEAIKNDKSNDVNDTANSKIKIKELTQKLFEKNEVDINRIKDVIDEINEEQKNERKSECSLIKELIKLNNYDWAGLYQNNLEQAIVNNYVKKIDNFEELENKIESEIYHKAKAYTLTSWYNNWSSILIEDIFKRHSRVTPVVGKIRKMDFFINKKPFDLKVTYLPDGYVERELKKEAKKCGQKYYSDKNRLSAFCKENKIKLCDDTKIVDIDYKARDYWNAVKSCNTKKAKNLILELIEDRKSIIKNVESNPKDLIEWLYKNQGQRRFDSTDRIYLILHDTMNYYDSWKLKSDLKFIAEGVNSFLDSFDVNDCDDIDFELRGNSYKAKSKIILLAYTKN